MDNVSHFARSRPTAWLVPNGLLLWHCPCGWQNLWTGDVCRTWFLAGCMSIQNHVLFKIYYEFFRWVTANLGWRRTAPRSSPESESSGDFHAFVWRLPMWNNWNVIFLTIAETGHGIRGCFSASTSVTQSEISTRGISVELSVYQVWCEFNHWCCMLPSAPGPCEHDLLLRELWEGIEGSWRETGCCTRQSVLIRTCCRVVLRTDM